MIKFDNLKYNCSLRLKKQRNILNNVSYDMSVYGSLCFTCPFFFIYGYECKTSDAGNLITCGLEGFCLLLGSAGPKMPQQHSE